MRNYQGLFYKAKFINGGELADHPKTIEEMREAIDKTNAHYKVNGYEQAQFVIVSVQWGRVFDDNGVFVEEHENVTRVEIYPETLSKPKVKAITAKEAKAIAEKIGVDLHGDGETFYATSAEEDEIYSFDNPTERNTFVKRNA